MPKQNKYPFISRALHWLLAGAIFGMFALGLYMTSRTNYTPFVISLYGWHKSVGFMVLVAVALRLSWRLAFVRLPEAPAPKWQQRAARLTHYALYVLMLAVPLFGWAMSSAKGLPVSVFGWFMLPDIAPASKQLGHFLHECHEYAAFTLIGVSAVHIGAALYHQFIVKDGLLRRMWLVVMGLLVAGSSPLFTPAFAQNPRDSQLDWQLDKANSHINFTATMNNAPSRGSFEAFASDFAFDAQALRQNPTDTPFHIRLTVDLTKLSTAYDAVAPALQKATWFDTQNHPQGIFEATNVRAANKNHKKIEHKSAENFVLEGRLTLKGKTKEIAVPVQVTKTNQKLVITGNTTLQRLDFNIGDGPWSDAKTIQNPIKVDYKFTLIKQ